MIFDLLRSRRSVRRFRPEMPPREMIERIIEAASLAPSASNRQPWRFFVVTSRTRIDALSAGVERAIDRIATSLDPESEPAFRAYGDYFVRFREAPIVVVVLAQSSPLLSNLTNARLEADDASRVARVEELSGIIGASLALENLLLAAHALGLGASAMTGPLLASDVLRVELKIPSSWEPIAVVPLGYPDEDPRATDRKPPERIIRWIED
jgi:nitroreductase